MFAVASVTRCSGVSALKQTGKCLSRRLPCASIDLAIGLSLRCSEAPEWLHVLEKLTRASADNVVSVDDELVKWVGIQY